VAETFVDKGYLDQAATVYISALELGYRDPWAGNRYISESLLPERLKTLAEKYAKRGDGDKGALLYASAIASVSKGDIYNLPCQRQLNLNLAMFEAERGHLTNAAEAFARFAELASAIHDHEERVLRAGAQMYRQALEKSGLSAEASKIKDRFGL
jgi:hypothetical protein